MNTLWQALIVFPASFISALFAIALGFLPFAVGFAAASMIYRYASRRDLPGDRGMVRPLRTVIAGMIGLYVGIVAGVAVARLPVAIQWMIQPDRGTYD